MTTVNVNPHSNIECETKTSITDTPQPSITGRIDVSNDAYNERLVKTCANMAADLRKAKSDVRSSQQRIPQINSNTEDDIK